MEVYEPPVLLRPEPLTEGSGPFRANVAGLVVRHKGRELLLGERFDTPFCWQWPQGGLEPGEQPEQGLRRELLEETGLGQLRVVYKFPFKLRYRFPLSMASRFPNPGQEQIFFVVETEETPDLKKATTREFRQLAWAPIEEAANRAVWFKKPVYQHILGSLEQVRPQLVFHS